MTRDRLPETKFGMQCPYFRQGRCSHGHKCRFYHDENNITQAILWFNRPGVRPRHVYYDCTYCKKLCNSFFQLLEHRCK